MSSRVPPVASGFGALLRHYRTAAGLSQEDLAAKAGLSTDAISAHERGRRRPYRHTVQRLADALALPPPDRVAFEAAARRSGSPVSGASPAAPWPVPDGAGDPDAGSDGADHAPNATAVPMHHADAPLYPGGIRVPLVGRGRERALLERHLAAGGPPLLLLAGEPGIGKTRLLQEAIAQAPAAGWTVLAGGCQRQGEDEPYAPLLGALQRHIERRPGTGRGPNRGAELAGCAWLVRLLPELAERGLAPLPTGLAEPAQERRLMFGAVARYLANVAGPAGTLLVLDDLQWAGADACALLSMLIRATVPLPALSADPSASDAAPLRAVAAYRDTETRPDDPVALMATDLASAGLALHQSLVPLTPTEARQLLDRVLDVAGHTLLRESASGAADTRDTEEESARRERVVARTGGVPFFVVNCVQDLAAAPPGAAGQRQEGASWAVPRDVPWDVAQSIRQRVAVLPRPAQEVLGVAAVIGRVVPPSLLTAVAAQAEHGTLAALRATTAAGFLVEEGAAYRFAHDVIRDVIEVDVGLAQRQVLHRRIAAALEGGPAVPPVELLAYHYSRSDAQDRAVPYLDQAGDAALQRAAFAAADAFYGTLVERLDELGRRHEAAGARTKWAVALWATARHDAALPVLEHAAATYHADGDLERLVHVTVQIATAYAEKGQSDVGLARLEALRETAEARGLTVSLAALYVAQGHLLYFSGRIEEALAATERAADLAHALADDRLLAQAEVARGYALRMLGRVAEALPVMENAVRQAEAVGDQGRVSLIGALDNLAWVHGARGEFDVAVRYNARAQELAEDQGHPFLVVITTCTRGALAVLRGDWEQARGDLERAVVLGREIGEGRGLAYALAELGRLYVAAGAWETAARLLEEGQSMAERSGDLQGLRLVQGVLAELDLREGRPAGAQARLVPVLDRPGLEEWDVTELLPLVAWAHLERGEGRRAVAVAADAARRARAQTNRVALMEALRVQGLVALQQGHGSTAEGSLAEALVLARTIGVPYLEARVLQAYGMVFAAANEPDRARKQWQSARGIFQHLGAHRDAERTDQAIAALDRPAPAQRGWPL
jgi:tetratricopeptide (TPR) repeat protein/transcriptional regulator with XRE-family HTH domain